MTAETSTLLIEAVWIQGATQDGVQAVLARFTHWNEEHRTTANPLARLTRAMDQNGVEAFASSVLQNRQRLLTRNGGVLKAQVVYQMAEVLQAHGVETAEDVCRLLQDSSLEATLRKIPGVTDGTLRRLHALCEATTHDVERAESLPTVPRSPLPKMPELSLHIPEPEVATAVEIAPEPLAVPTAVPTRKARKRAVALEAEPQVPLSVEKEGDEEAIPAAPSVGYHVRMREMPLDERPRERLIQYGAEAVSVEELLAILLRTGTGKMNAVDLAHHLLTRHGGMRGLAMLTVEEMSQIHGIGPAKAAQIKAAIEFGRRLVALSSEERTKIRSPRDVYNLLGPSLRDEKREHFIAILMDTKGGVIRQKTVSIGDLSSSLVHPREVFTEAIRHSAASLIVSHNHPSGDPAPSPDDVAVTRRLVQAGELVGIELLDHIVLGDGRWVSLKEKGFM